MMLKLLTAFTIFSSSLIVSTEAIFLQLRFRIMCLIARSRIKLLSHTICEFCEEIGGEYGEGFLTSCDDGYAFFQTKAAFVAFKNRQDQFVYFEWGEPGFFGRYGKAKFCLAYEGDNFDKPCKCEVKNLLATPTIPGPLSYQVSDCQVDTSAKTEGNTIFGSFNKKQIGEGV